MCLWEKIYVGSHSLGLGRQWGESLLYIEFTESSLINFLFFLLLQFLVYSPFTNFPTPFIDISIFISIHV